MAACNFLPNLGDSMQQSKAIQDDSNVQFILPDTSGKLPAVTHSEDIISQTIHTARYIRQTSSIHTF